MVETAPDCSHTLPWSCFSSFRVAIGAADHKDNPVRRGIHIPACTLGAGADGELCVLVLAAQGFNSVFIAVIMGILPNVSFLCKKCYRKRMPLVTIVLLQRSELPDGSAGIGCTGPEGAGGSGIHSAQSGGIRN